MNIKTKLFYLFFAFILLFSINFSYTNIGGTCYCSSCGDCSNALIDSACNIVTPISDVSGALTCISQTTTSVSTTLDCNGKTISAYSVFGLPNVFAIKLLTSGGSLNIRNCKITSDGIGIRLDGLNDVNIDNVDLSGSYASVINPSIKIIGASNKATLSNINSSNFLELANIQNTNNLVVSKFLGTTVVWKNGRNGEIRDGFTLLTTTVDLNNITNFTLTNLTSLNASINGIDVKDSNQGDINNLNIYYSNTHGIVLTNTNNTDIYNVDVRNSNWTGVRVEKSSDVVVRNSYLYSNEYGGIHSLDSPNTQIYDIEAVSNGVGGVIISSPNSIVRDVLTYSHSGSNNSGIVVGQNSSNTDIYSITSENNTVGLTFYRSGGALVRDSTFRNNQVGVVFSLSEGANTLRSNKIHFSTSVGIGLGSLYNPTPPDLIYNNFLNNSLNVDWNITVYPVYWNTSKTSGSNILGGPFLGGNVWSNPSGTGFSDTCLDSDDDSICDSSYTINGISNIDYYPIAVGNYVTYAKGNIFFVDPTPPNNTILYNRDYLEVNATTNLTENYTKIILHLYNYTSYYSSYTCDTPPIKPCYYNFTSLGEDVYYILAELYMVNSTVYQSEVRVVGLTNFSLYCTP